MSLPMHSYLVICQQIYLSGGGPIEFAYNWDGKRFASRTDAINHGFNIRGSDDFNIAVCDGRKVVSFDWMSTPVGRTDDDRQEECRIVQGKIFP